MATLSETGLHQGSCDRPRLRADSRVRGLAFAMLLLSGCGGGGDGSSSNNNGNPGGGSSGVSMSVSPTSVSVSATAGQSAPTATFQVSINGAQQNQQVYLTGKYSTSGIDSVNDASGASPILVTIQFKAPGSLGAGVYHDQVTVSACYDQACTQQVSNSPQTVDVTYTVVASLVQVSSLSPTSAVAGGPAFTLTVTGQNFTPQSSVLWNGNFHPTTYLSATQLSAQIATADIATAGSVPVSVSDPVNGPS